MKELSKSQINPIPIRKPSGELKSAYADLTELINNEKFKEWVEKEVEPNFFEKLLYILKYVPKGIVILYRLVLLYFKVKDFMSLTRDQKTNNAAYASIIIAILAFAKIVLGMFGINIPDDVMVDLQTAIIGAIAAILAIIGFFTGKGGSTD